MSQAEYGAKGGKRKGSLRVALGDEREPLANNKNNNKKPKEEKIYHGEFQNVLLTAAEYDKLSAKLNGSCQKYIDRLSTYLASSGKKYESHYAALLGFIERDGGAPQDQKRGLVV